MSLPTHLEADMAAWDRGEMENDHRRAAEFYSALMRNGDVPARVLADINESIDHGWINAAGDLLEPEDWGGGSYGVQTGASPGSTSIAHDGRQ